MGGIKTGLRKHIRFFCFIKITLHLLISSAGQKELLDAEIIFIFKSFIGVAAKQLCLEG
jgi:hypothetical protein